MTCSIFLNTFKVATNDWGEAGGLPIPLDVFLECWRLQGNRTINTENPHVDSLQGFARLRPWGRWGSLRRTTSPIPSRDLFLLDNAKEVVQALEEYVIFRVSVTVRHDLRAVTEGRWGMDQGIFESPQRRQHNCNASKYRTLLKQWQIPLPMFPTDRSPGDAGDPLPRSFPAA